MNVATDLLGKSVTVYERIDSGHYRWFSGVVRAIAFRNDARYPAFQFIVQNTDPGTEIGMLIPVSLSDQFAIRPDDAP